MHFDYWYILISDIDMSYWYLLSDTYWAVYINFMGILFYICEWLRSYKIRSFVID